ncbi:MAG TPA: hypothetical protein VM915_13625 [Verrucomicrobiae bacterium]|nr:hypothetical protein [Verrucomicrobiae bacterium]
MQQTYLIDLQTGQSRLVVAAPHDFVTNVLWSPDSRSFVFGPTYLPPPGDAQSLAGRAMIEIDVPSGRTRRVPASDEVTTRRVLDGLVWADRDTIVMQTGDVREAARRSGGRWRSVAPPAPQVLEPAVRLEVRQDENTPPRLFAIDASGDARMIFDPNPDLTARFALGHVERFRWEGADGRMWSGTLYYPVGYEEGRRYPLVIQAHGHAGPGEFSLNGFGGSHPAMGPSTSIYVAQPLAGRGIVVLQMEDQDIFDLEEANAYMRAYETAISSLDARGLIDPARVGIGGFSRTGWHILYALTHSDFEFAAAIVSDNIDAGYFQGALMPGYFLSEHGGLSYGEGLERWLETAPPFSVERVRTPLRLQTEGAWNAPFLLASWEMFSRLRHLNRPVEYYVVPDVLNGSHALQNPTQVLASQQGAVEWFDYWLNGELPAAIERREDLHRLRALRDRVSVGPRAPLLDWSVTARP